MAASKEPRRLEQANIGFAVWRGFPAPMRASHSHGELELNFLIRGGVRYFLGNSFYAIPAHRLAVFWAGMPHALVSVQAPVECLWATVPLGWFMQWRVAEAFTRRLLQGEVMLEPDGAADTGAADQLSMERWVRDMRSGEPEARRVVILEVEARLRRLALACKQRGGPAPPRLSGSSQVEFVANYIGRNYQQPLTVKRIAAAAGLHPNYLMQMFKRNCGMSLWEYVLRLRTSHAQRLLVLTDSKILDLALDSGFGSVGRFYEAFQRFCGQTPRDYRLTMGQPRPLKGKRTGN